eukprot:gb/GECG01006415.1/.p1 GENE.gb/GECG01006415.1/~~gb/GECG01006415.1/.p1  ORF type:complete len:193 (+),score=43.23 gb/GECG01006415.1/:1-579(+)
MSGGRKRTTATSSSSIQGATEDDEDDAGEATSASGMSYGARIVRNQVKSIQNSIKRQQRKEEQKRSSSSATGKQGIQQKKGHTRKPLSSSAKRSRQRKRDRRQQQAEEESGAQSTKKKRTRSHGANTFTTNILEQMRQESLEAQSKRKRNLSVIRQMDAIGAPSRRKLQHQEQWQTRGEDNPHRAISEIYGV